MVQVLCMRQYNFHQSYYQFQIKAFCQAREIQMTDKVQKQILPSCQTLIGSIRTRYFRPTWLQASVVVRMTLKNHFLKSQGHTRLDGFRRVGSNRQIGKQRPTRRRSTEPLTFGHRNRVVGAQSKRSRLQQLTKVKFIMCPAANQIRTNVVAPSHIFNFTLVKEFFV